MDIVLRHEAVEKAKAGDKCVFTGTLIVIPDVGKISRTGGMKIVGAVALTCYFGCRPLPFFFFLYFAIDKPTLLPVCREEHDAERQLAHSGRHGTRRYARGWLACFSH